MLAEGPPCATGLDLWSQAPVALTPLGFEVPLSSLLPVVFRHQLCARPRIPNGSDPVGLFSLQWGRPTGEMGGDGGCQVGTEGPWRAGLSREAALEPGFYDAENFTSGR